MSVKLAKLRRGEALSRPDVMTKEYPPYTVASGIPRKADQKAYPRNITRLSRADDEAARIRLREASVRGS